MKQSTYLAAMIMLVAVIGSPAHATQYILTESGWMYITAEFPEYGSAAPAGQPELDQDEEKRVELASGLLEYGMESRDALALAHAAMMYRGFSARVLHKGETEADGNAVDPDALLEQAREFARGDADLLAVVDLVGQMESGAKQVYFPVCMWIFRCDIFGCFWRYECY